MLAMEAYYSANDAYTADLVALQVAASKDVTIVPTAPAAGSGDPVSVVGNRRLRPVPERPQLHPHPGRAAGLDNP